MWRPSPLYRAHRWEKALDTPAKIYYKWEGVSPAGSHKPNTAVAQCYYGKQEGLEGFATETGAGQWGSALSLATNMFGLKCKVFMVAVSYQQKPYRRIMMETWGGTVVPSPSSETHAGRAILAEDPESPGSLGIAISEAIEYAVTHEGYKYSLGSVVNFVLLHQTVIGLEALKQMEMAGDYPDILIGCAGGGSNAAGLIFPFMRDKLTGNKPDLRAIFVESTACPSMTRGIYAYDWGDTAKTGPVAKMHTVGHDFIPAPVHAGGLRYHGMAPSICALLRAGIRRSAGLPPDRGLRRGAELRAGGGHHHRAGNRARRQSDDGRGAGLQGIRRVEGHPLQRQRARALRPGVLRRLPSPDVDGLQTRRSADRARAGETA